MSGVAVVTDSTSSLNPVRAHDAGVIIVPLQVIVDGTSRPESFRPEAGSITPGGVAAALREGRSVSTSRPSPEAFLRAYASAAEQGATAVVSVHLSGAISGTCDAATQAGRLADVPVTVVDSRTVGPGCGLAALTAVRAARAGAPVAEVVEAAGRRAAAAVTYFCVENLDYLRRGGRIGTAKALLGSALAVKPLLTVQDGRIAPHERVRTMARALARLAELAVDTLSTEAGPAADAEVVVLHLDNRSAADRLARVLRDQGSATTVSVMEMSAVLGVHCGPGTIGLVVAPQA